jgi:hypothetical protein
MSSESVCQVARSGEEVGSFHTRLFGVVYFAIASVREFLDKSSYIHIFVWTRYFTCWLIITWLFRSSSQLQQDHKLEVNRATHHSLRRQAKPCYCNNITAILFPCVHITMQWIRSSFQTMFSETGTVLCLFNLLKAERRPLYLKAQSVPRCKHFSSRL